MVDALSAETDKQIASAVGWYALGELTAGQAAEQAGLSRRELYAALRGSSVDLRMGCPTYDRAVDDLETLRAVR